MAAVEDRLARLQLDRVPTPLGMLLIVSDGKALVALDYQDFEDRMNRLLARRYGRVELQRTDNPIGASDAARGYFAGELRAFDGLPWDGGGTAFQRRVWRGLRAIPCGQTLSYGALAARLEATKSPRAVGHANALNPIAIAVPCHRLIGHDGSLTGYAGGLERKRWLLRHEGALA